jgi:hypothetical protein
MPSLTDWWAALPQLACAMKRVLNQTKRMTSAPPAHETEATIDGPGPETIVLVKNF